MLYLKSASFNSFCLITPQYAAPFYFQNTLFKHCNVIRIIPVTNKQRGNNGHRNAQGVYFAHVQISCDMTPYEKDLVFWKCCRKIWEKLAQFVMECSPINSRQWYLHSFGNFLQFFLRYIITWWSFELIRPDWPYKVYVTWSREMSHLSKIFNYQFLTPPSDNLKMLHLKTSLLDLCLNIVYINL